MEIGWKGGKGGEGCRINKVELSVLLERCQSLHLRGLKISSDKLSSSLHVVWLELSTILKIFSVVLPIFSGILQVLSIVLAVLPSVSVVTKAAGGSSTIGIFLSSNIVIILIEAHSRNILLILLTNLLDSLVDITVITIHLCPVLSISKGAEFLLRLVSIHGELDTLALVQRFMLDVH
jgi:hypothetical protein